MRGIKGNDRSQEQRAMLGHELLNVLNGIQGTCELLGRSDLNGEQQQLLDTLQGSAGQLNYLLEFAGLGGTSAGFPCSPRLALINGVELLEQAVRCHTLAAASHKNLLLLNVEPGLSAWWHTDAFLVRRVIDNLVGNAIKFTHGGKVVVEAMPFAQNPASESGLEVRVTDNGPGIGSHYRHAVFDRGVQCQNGREMEGSGLGLYLCQKIVSSLRGTISYEPGVAAGACFRILLPDVIGRIPAWMPARNSRLFSSMSCAVSVRPELRKSLVTILARLGVRYGPAAADSVPDAGSDLQIQIREAEYSSETPRLISGLIVTRQAPLVSGARLPVSRSLQPPYLESTLGPLLMEMALEWRKSTQSPRPTPFIPGERPD